MAGEKPLGADWLSRHWKLGLLLAWLAFAILALILRYPAIQDLGLGDTDDNLRLAQLRALLAGQNWFDLTQYRLAPPEGADIHWSRLPELPIAALILLLRPLFGAVAGEQWAVALAPLIPLAIGWWAIALTARRLVDPAAWPLALLVTLCAVFLMPMWMPLRIDHHGWQLALLAVAVAGLADPRPLRGGVTSGIAGALSLAIGLEMLAFLALIGAATVFFWVADGAERRRIAGYGASLAGVGALAFLGFASNANRSPVCDAFSPVWLSAVAAAGGVLVLLALFDIERRPVRLALAALAGAILAAGFALAWPDCLGRLEGVSPELQAIWLDHVGEARPITRTPWRRALLMAALPVSGLIGYVLALRTRPSLPWLAMAVMALTGFAMLFWQVRLAPAAQLLAIPGACLLGWRLIPPGRRSPRLLVRVFGTVGVLVFVTGIHAAFVILGFPAQSAAAETVADDCKSRAALARLDALPASTFLTQLDMAPRLIVTTHHAALAGPYHRNGAAMLDTLHAFRGRPDAARAIVERRGIDYVLLCPALSGAHVYIGDQEGGLYETLVAGRAPGWLEPVPLGEESGLRVWR
ncbi:MAG: AcrB/AcrD/AcrF family protein, partial [Parasphingopyxis sp.]